MLLRERPGGKRVVANEERLGGKPGKRVVVAGLGNPVRADAARGVLIVDGRIEEVTNRCGFDCTWSIYETSADNDEERKRRIIEAFDELY